MALKNNGQIDRKFVLFGLKIVGDFGVTIAVPVIFFVYLGQKLDARYGTSIRFTVIAFVVSALISGLLVYKHAKEYGKQYQDLSKDDKK